MISRWFNPMELQRISEMALCEVTKKGIVLCNDPVYLNQMRAVYIPVFLSLQAEILLSDLAFWYCYRQIEQPPPISKYDGYSSADIIGGRRIASLGLSIEALDTGVDYAAFVCLHELAHVITGRDHDRKYHTYLDRLIQKYNGATGKHIQNDYQGITEGNVTP